MQSSNNIKRKNNYLFGVAHSGFPNPKIRFERNRYYAIP